MKKLVYIADIGSKIRTGGGYTYGYELLKLIKEFQFDQIICYLPYKTTEKNYLIDVNQYKNKKIEIKQVEINDKLIWSNQIIGTILGDILIYLKIKNQIKKINPDLIIYDQPSIFINKFKSKKKCIMFHGGFGKRTLKDIIKYPRSSLTKLIWTNFLTSRAVKFYLDSSNIKLYNSLLTKKMLEANYKQSLDGDVVGLPLAQQFESELPVEVEEYFARKESNVVIGMIGNLSKRKVPNDIPNIFDGLRNYKLIIVGRSIDSERLDKWSKNNPNVIRIEEVNRNIALSITSKCDILLTTANMETFGYSVAEGLMMGKPYIVRKNAGALDEIIINNYNGYAAKDILEFKKYIQLLIDDKSLREQLGLNAKEFVERNFEAQTWIKKIKRILV